MGQDDATHAPGLSPVCLTQPAKGSSHQREGTCGDDSWPIAYCLNSTPAPIIRSACTQQHPTPCPHTMPKKEPRLSSPPPSQNLARQWLSSRGAAQVMRGGHRKVGGGLLLGVRGNFRFQGAYRVKRQMRFVLDPLKQTPGICYVGTCDVSWPKAKGIIPSCHPPPRSVISNCRLCRRKWHFAGSKDVRSRNDTAY